MATNFPTSKDSYTTLVDGTDYPKAAYLNDRGDAIEALETKVGIDGSTVTTSHDYKISTLETHNTNIKYTVDYSSFASAISDIGSSDATLIVSSPQTLTADITVPSNIYLLALQNAFFTGNHTITFNGKLDAAAYQIFDTGTTVTFATNATNIIFPEWFGGTDTQKGQLAINAAPRGSTVLFADTYTITGFNITDKTGIEIKGNGKISLGSAASDAIIFQPQGTITDVKIADLELIGEGTTTYTQEAIGNSSGQTITELLVDNLYIHDINVGIDINSNLSGSAKIATVQNNRIEDIVGTDAGQGYGIHIGTGGTTLTSYEGRVDVIGNKIRNCSRHGIYIGHTKAVSITDNIIKDHRADVHDGSIRVALSISRSENIVAKGNHFIDCYGGCLMVDKDADTVSKKTIIANNIFENFHEGGVYIGYQDPANDTPSDVLIYGNIFDPDDTESQTAISIRSGKGVVVEGNIIGIPGKSSDANCPGITIGYSDATYDTNSNDIVVRNNNIYLPSARCIEIDSSVATGSARYTIENNKCPFATSIGGIYYAATPTITSLDVRTDVSNQTLSAPGCTQSATDGYVGNGNAFWFTYGSSGKTAQIPASDTRWEIPSSANTGSGEFRKVIVGISYNGSSSYILVGDTAGSQADAVLPKIPYAGIVPCGIVEINENWTAGNAVTGNIYDIIGALR